MVYEDACGAKSKDFTLHMGKLRFIKLEQFTEGFRENIQ